MKLFILAVFLCFCLAFTTYADKVDFKFCSPPDVPQPYQIESIDLNPLYPKPGDNVQITIVGTAVNGTTSGLVTSEVSKAGIKLFSFTYDLCESVVGGCPTKPGESTIIIHQSTPRFAFPGEYEALNHAYNADKKIISCASFKFTVKSS